MFTTNQPFLLYMILVGVVGCGLAVRAWPKMKTMGKWHIIGAGFLPLLSCVLFWSLALHMHTHFNGWPEQIGDDGFPWALGQHANSQGFLFSCTFGVAFVVAPLLALIFSLTPKLRPLLDYLGVFYLAFLLLALCIFADIAPKGYRVWFWD